MEAGGGSQERSFPPGMGTDSLLWTPTRLGRGPGLYLSLAKSVGEPLYWWLSGKDSTGPCRAASE